MRCSRVNEVPSDVCALSKLRELDLHGCPLVMPPHHVVFGASSRELMAILRRFFREHHARIFWVSRAFERVCNGVALPPDVCTVVEALAYERGQHVADEMPMALRSLTASFAKGFSLADEIMGDI